MAERFPKDRFDDQPDDLKRVGAHRAPAPKGRGWIVFMWAAIATVVLIVIGVVGLLVLDDRLDLGTDTGSSQTTPAPSEDPVPTVEPTIDPNAVITVLNGTATQGLSAAAISQLNSAGWSQPITNANASDNTIETTTVYYEDASQEGAARGIAVALGGAAIQLSSEFQVPNADGEVPAAQIWVVLGADYAPATG
ncbi:LytR C-terminal domain-containing protein [Okibacterium endophyticum]